MTYDGETTLETAHDLLDRPFVVEPDRAGGWHVMNVLGGMAWGIGVSFRKESVAKDAAATLNALVALDRAD